MVLEVLEVEEALLEVEEALLEVEEALLEVEEALGVLLEVEEAVVEGEVVLGASYIWTSSNANPSASRKLSDAKKTLKMSEGAVAIS
jgi:hypothetical protein